MKKTGIFQILVVLMITALCLVGTGGTKAEAAGQLADFSEAVAHHSQIVFVAAEGSRATVRMFQKTAAGEWQSICWTPDAWIGKHGLGKTREGDGKTPIGIFTMQQAFGIQADPGTRLPYTKVNSQHYWVDDVNSRYYNRMIRKDRAAADWNSGEHIVDYPVQYAYAIAVDYNLDCVKGAGSGIFFHCSANKPTAGCVAVPERTMSAILQQIQPDAVISIDTAANIDSQIKSLQNRGH